MLTAMQISGLLTLLLSSTSAAAGLVGFFFLRRSRSDVGKRLASYLLVHSAFFTMTMLFGVSGLVGAPLWIWHILYETRVILIVADLIAITSLVLTFRKIANQPE